MDEAVIRAQLKEVRAALKQNEDEHSVLLSLLQGYEGWLRLRGLNGHKPRQPEITDAPPSAITARQGSAKVTVFRQAVLQVVRDAHGEPLSIGEILRRAGELGANSGAKNQLGHTDVTLYKWQKLGLPVEKVRRRTWRWNGE